MFVGDSVRIKLLTEGSLKQFKLYEIIGIKNRIIACVRPFTDRSEECYFINLRESNKAAGFLFITPDRESLQSYLEEFAVTDASLPNTSPIELEFIHY